MENIETGLLLMCVGMSTVFVILLIVIYLGKLLISLVNKYAPEEVLAKKPARTNNQASQAGSPTTAEAAAIISAVSMFTRGTGKVIKIEKL